MSAVETVPHVAALEALADSWEMLAKSNDELGQSAEEDGNDYLTGRAYGSRDAHNSAAKALRNLIKAAQS